MIRGISGACALWLCAAMAQAGPVSIGFEGAEAGAAPAEMAEDGYRIVTRDAMISGPAASGDGTDGPNEIEAAMGRRGAIAILRGVPFTLVSLDWQSEGGAPRVVAEGYLGQTLVAQDRFITGNTGFVTFAAQALAGKVIDRLILYPQRDRQGLGALDRVILDDAPGHAPGL
jgi:hypothetical protein